MKLKTIMLGFVPGIVEWNFDSSEEMPRRLIESRNHTYATSLITFGFLGLAYLYLEKDPFLGYPSGAAAIFTASLTGTLIGNTYCLAHNILK